MTLGRSFPFRMRHGAPSHAQRIEVAPRGSLVPLEAPAGRGAGDVPLPAKDDVHYGSANLELHPPSTVELDLARTVIRIPEMDGIAPYASALSDLIIVAQSEARTAAILHRARVERVAEAVVARVRGAG